MASAGRTADYGPGEGVLVGRETQSRDILATLVDPDRLGALVVGDPGVGKTALASRLLQVAAAGTHTLRVTARSSLRAVPFGALAPFLDGVSAADAASPVIVYRRLLRELRTDSDTGLLPVIVVDDAQDLDESSSVLLAQLAVARRATLLVLSRSIPGPPAEFSSLVAEGLLQRFDLTPLVLEQVHEVCRRVLGGEVLQCVSAALTQVTGGNPLFLLALLSEESRHDYLALHHGVWCLTGELPATNLQLTDLVESQLRQVTKAESEVLETVALAEPLALDVLTSCCDPDAVTSLLSQKLIAIPGGAEPRVSLGHPLYGEVIRFTMPIGRSRAIRRQVLTAPTTASDSVEGFLREVSWGLDCGADLDDTTLLRAAVVANRLHHPGFALRSARSVRAPDLKSRAMVEIARARMVGGELTYARELVEEALGDCDQLLLAKEATLLSIDLRIRDGGQPADIRADARRWGNLIDHYQELHGSAPEPQAAAARLGCRILDCFALNLEGRYREAEKDLRSILAAPNGTDETRLAALALLGEALSSTGMPFLGAAATGEALDIMTRKGRSLLRHREFVLLRHLTALTHAGQWDEVSEVLHHYAQTAAGDLVSFGGVLEFSDGFAALRQGRTVTARKRFILAVEGFRESDFARLLPLATGLAAHACAMAGDSAGVKRYVTEFQALRRSGATQNWLLGQAYAAAGNSLFTGTMGSIPELRRIAAEAEASGMLTLVALALELAVRQGDTGSLIRLRDLTESFDSGEGVVLNSMAAAMLARDPLQLEAVADQAITAGYLLIGAECFAAASDQLARNGHIQRSRAVHARLNGMAEELEGYRTPAFAELNPATRLTRREQDIVTLASLGYSNRDIAAQYSVSVRTVEGHLYRIFAKLGITRREDLPEPGTF